MQVPPGLALQIRSVRPSLFADKRREYVVEFANGSTKPCRSERVLEYHLTRTPTNLL